jgi:hypothetical protein
MDSVKYKGGIVTGGECKIGCKYCYLRQSNKMTPYIPWNIPLISKNDFKKAVLTIKKYKYETVTLGDGVDLISSEPFIHPLIYDFIEELETTPLIRNIDITTSGLCIEKEKYAFLRHCKKITWRISCSSLSKEGRRKVVSVEDPTKLLDFLYFLHEETPCSASMIQLVIYSLEFFIKDREIIKNNFPKFLRRIYIRELGYSKFFSEKAKSIIQHCHGTFNEVLKYCVKNNISINWDDSSLNENFELKCKFDCFKARVNEFIKYINAALVHCVIKKFNAPLLCIPESCFFILPKVRNEIILPEMKKRYLKIKNITFGGNYKSYGLLTLGDFSHALENVRLKDYDAIVLNGIFLNQDQRDLRREHISNFKNKINIPVIVMNHFGVFE